MTDCLSLYFQRRIPYFFVDPVLLALFLVELRWLLALRGRRAGTLAFYVWQYVSTLAPYVAFYILLMTMTESLVYIPGVTECLEFYKQRFDRVFELGFVTPILGLAPTSYATCTVLEERACRILMPVLVLRTIVAGFLTWLFIVSLTQNTSLWLPVSIYFALFVLYYITRTLAR